MKKYGRKRFKSVKELKQCIEKYDNCEKDKIIVELYKLVPKRKREEYDIDDLIKNIELKSDVKKKEQTNLSISELEEAVNYFIKCANEDLYASVNNVISKTERQNWRFKVKRYYKNLLIYLPGTDEGKIATDLLSKLYYLMSYASNYLTFSNWETFRAIGISQSEFLKVVMERKLNEGINKDTMAYCVNLLTAEDDPYALSIYLQEAFISCLKTDDVKFLAIECLIEKNNEISDTVKVRQKKREDIRGLKGKRYNLTECITKISFDLSEFTEGIKYFHKNYSDIDKEVKEYILLEILEDRNLIQEWIKEYESNEIDYRESLKEKYREFKNR